MMCVNRCVMSFSSVSDWLACTLDAVRVLLECIGGVGCAALCAVEIVEGLFKLTIDSDGSESVIV